MTISYKIDPDLNLIYYMASEVCKATEILQVEQEAFRDPLRRPRMKIILDALHADLDIDLKDIHSLITLNRQLDRKGWDLEETAVLTRNSFFTTLSDTLQMLADDLSIKLKVFHTLDDALHWLGLTEYGEEIIKIQAGLTNKVSDTINKN